MISGVLEYRDLSGECDEHIAATFRNPLDHVYSLYLECSYSSYGRLVEKFAKFELLRLL